MVYIRGWRTMACMPNLVTYICLNIIGGCFYATPVGLSICDRDHMAHQAYIHCYLALC